MGELVLEFASWAEKQRWVVTCSHPRETERQSYSLLIFGLVLHLIWKSLWYKSGWIGHLEQMTITPSPGLRARIQTHTVCCQRFKTLPHFLWHTLLKENARPLQGIMSPQQPRAFVSWIIPPLFWFRLLSTISLPFSERFPSLLFILVWHLGSPEFLYP